MTEEKVNNIIQIYKEIKEHLVPIKQITEENEEHITLYHKTALSELKDNQGVTYDNFGEIIELGLNLIMTYSNEIPTLVAKPLSESAANMHIAVNKDFDNGTQHKVAENERAENIVGYRKSLDIYSHITAIRIDISKLKLHSNNRNKDLDFSPVIYYITQDKIFSYLNKVDLKPADIFGLFLVGIKMNEQINDDEEVTFNDEVVFDIYYNTGDKDSLNINLLKRSKTFRVPIVVNAEEIPLFSFIDIFGNRLKTRTGDNVYTHDYNSNLSEDVNEKIDKLIIDGKSINISQIEKLVKMKKLSTFLKPKNILFNLYKKEDITDFCYFPAISPLNIQYEKAIDGI